MELREKIIAACVAVQGYKGLEHERIADRILAIPEIAEALKLTVISGHPLQERE